MASYDSDSDIGDQDFTETNVLLGYASKDADEDTISRLGGVPEWIGDQTPSAALAKCNNCKDMMVLLLQLNGELPDKFPGHERRLYVFSCRRQTCQRRQGSVRAIRGTKISKEAVEALKAAKEAEQAEEKRRKEEASKPKGPGLGNALFGGSPTAGSGSANPFSSGSANPFSSGGASQNTNPFATSSSNPFSSSATPESAMQEEAPKKDDPVSALPKTFAETLNLNNTQKVDQEPPPPPEPWPATDKLPKPYPVSYLSDAEYETLDPEPAPVPQKTTMDIDDGPEQGGSGGGVDKEVFESTMDAVFQKFADRLAQNPDQSIRYEFGGTPLLYSKKDNVGKVLTAAAAAKKSGMPRCGNCGAGRVFEVQLTPQAIAELEDQDELGLEGMEWGTVIVGVCEADCLARGSGDDEAGYVEEWCGVQWEELAKK